MLVGLVAAQIAIVAYAPDSVQACEAIELSVAISAPASDRPRFSLPGLRPFDILRATTTPRLTLDPASRSRVVAEYRYVITTDQVGRHTIPPFEVRTRAGSAVSLPIAINVTPSRRGSPSVVARARIDTGAGSGLRASSADTVYVGQQATYEVAVFLNQAARDRLRRNPTFYPPEMQAMLAYDVPAAGQGLREHSGSQCFDALVYRRAVFPLVAGRLVIPPAQLVYSTGVSRTSMFSREESHELQTDSVAIVAVEPPRSGRPSEFSGAVGALRVDALVGAAASRVGDPMLYTVRVSGSGNVKLFPRPTVRIPWAYLVPADERVRVDSSSARVGGVKEFDWVLTPRIAGEFDVPPVRYGYFDPGRRRYEVAVTAADRLRVGAGSLASADTGQAEGPLSIRTRYSGPAPRSPQSNPFFWVVLAIAPLPALMSRGARRNRARPVVTATPMQSLAAAAASEDAVTLRRYYVRALAARLGCSPEDFTHPGALEKKLKRAGVSESTAQRAEAQLRELDSAAYAATGDLPANAARRSHELARAVDAEALSRAELPFWLPLVLTAALLGTATTLIAAPGSGQSAGAERQTPGAAFATGVSQYLRHDYVAARDAFATSVQGEPRSADAWANYGTASWAAADTAAAIHGWRQALVHEPAARDVRSRLGGTRPLLAGAPGWLPPLPAHAGAWLFVALWLATWVMAWLGRTTAGALKRQTAPLVAASLAVGLVAIGIDEQVAGEDVAVVRRTLSLTSEPAVGMDRGALLGTGELVQVTGRSGAWVRIVATEDREGWLPVDHLILLSDRRVPRD